jgi:sulfur carrier protein ThiS adenylyltransferase
VSAEPREPASPCPLDQAGVRARLADASVGIIGLGGLGSNAAMMLVRSGVRRFVLADFDKVEPSNLARQLFFPDQLGQLKTEALAETLLRIEPDLDLTLVAECLQADDIPRLFGAVDVLLEAVDRAETKQMIVETASDSLPETPLIWVAGLAGCASANAIATQRVGETIWVVGDLEADIRDGLPLLASRVMAAAAHEAHIATRILLGMPDA